MAQYTAHQIAHYIINKCIDLENPISNLQLQKILYFCQEKYVKETGTPLFDDLFEAWKYGPVVPEVYRSYSLWGGNCIDRKNDDPVLISKEVQAIINPVIIEKMVKPAWQLVSETHVPDSPWYKIYDDGSGDGKVIPLEMLLD